MILLLPIPNFLKRFDSRLLALLIFHINYDQVYDPENLYPGIVEGLYNGNISETYWLSSTDNTIRKYGYRYDKLNRLKDAYFQQPYSLNYNCQSYNEHLSYDKNGNILTLNRNSRVENFLTAVEIDQLEYFYQGNQLTKVTDKSGWPQGFKDDSDGSNDINDDYAYDAFGNMVHDENKNIELIRYNHLNLPVEILFENGSTIHYLYNAAGQKLRKIVSDISTSGVSTTEYLDGFQYNNSILQFFSHPEGYVLNTPDSQGNPSYDYVYQYKDHLGNIRLNFVFDSDAADLKVLEENHYYPFGLKHENYNVTKKNMKWESELIGGEEMELKRVRQVPNSGYQYKYNGQEYQDELGLNVTAMDFRQYDSAIGRFYNIDAMAEIMPSISPYRFGFNNPVIWKDPTGLSEDPPIETIELDEVVVSAKRKTPERTYTRPSNFGDYSLLQGSGRSKFKGDISIYEYNKKYATDFKDFDDWYYRTKYLPFEKDMYRSMHSAQNAAGIFVAVVAGSVFAAPIMVASSPSVISAVSATITNPIAQKSLVLGLTNALSQQLVNGKVDQADVAISMLPGG